MRAALAAGLVWVGVLAVAASAPMAQQAPPENLQVLSKDMTRAEVTAFMRTVAAALGVQCTHCHVGSPADRAKDEKPEKLTARRMLQMTMAINNDLLKGVGAPAAAGTMKVTCFTCHRGSRKPLTAPPAGRSLVMIP